ncbi:MAG: hypothetical protein U5L98_16515 [Halomonas sp.]|uniref:hypothetical protein n=1 Tax=Halomonas sp. TaxID=1486246 RepID=UPI002ACE61EE|nr:hypothetical protein [Halomonas sp.]MDZ7854187.1 hypothetical protein [Halomonas sp.]
MLSADIIRTEDDRYECMVLTDSVENVRPSLAMGKDPAIQELCMDYDFFLGRSPDFGVWTLLAVDAEAPMEVLDPADLVAWMSDPPCKNLQAITDGLIELFLKSRQQWWVTNDDIRATLERLDFSIPIVRELLPGAPERWHPLPARFHNHFGLSEGHGVDRGMFLFWERHDAQEIIATLVEGRWHGILLIYELFAENVLPMEPYEVDWPLQRRGKTHPKRKSREDKQCLCRIYQQVNRRVGFCTPPVFDEPVIRLAVSGRSPDDAINNWYAIARQLRLALRDNQRDATRK